MQQNELVAGDSLNFLTTATGYLASAGWELHYRLIPRDAGGTAIDMTAVAEGDDYRVQIAASTTAAWTAGSYGWASWVQSGSGEKYTIQTGQLTVLPDPRAAAVGTDTRSLARKAWEDAKTALANWSPTRKRYRIGEREMEFNSAADIIRLVNYWETEVQREENAERKAAGLPDRRKAFIRFGARV